MAARNFERKGLHQRMGKGNYTFIGFAASLSPQRNRLQNFSELYAKELVQNPCTKDFTDKIKAELKNRNVTVLYANKDVEQSHIPVLQRFIEKVLNG